MLITGAFGQDFSAFARKLDENARVLANAEALIRDMLLRGCGMEAIMAELRGYDIVASAEVGSGIVPLDAFEREWREAVGRACSALALEAESVIRLVCGIPVVLKGEPCWN